VAALTAELIEGTGCFLGLGGEVKHVVALYDEFARGARGSMISSICAMIRDSGGLSVAIGALVGTAGLALLANRVRENAVAMAELGERTVNAAAVGTTPHEFSRYRRR
jgi:hypothetical protein